MTREQLIAQLELLPKGTEVFVVVGDRIADPYVRIYDVNRPHAKEKLVAYIDSFVGGLSERMDEVPNYLIEALSDERHEYLHEVCHHGRSIMGTCGGCDEETEELEDDEIDG